MLRVDCGRREIARDDTHPIAKGDDRMILICYDGSPDSKAAIEHGAELLKGQTAIVLTVWQPFIEVVTRAYAGFGMSAGMVDQEAIDKATRQHAEESAQEGAQLARDAGLDAQPHTRSQETTTADAILSEADAVDASAILMGSRGLTGLKSLLLGSVSHAVIQHADRIVIVAPSPEVAASRKRARHADRGSE
jgi:nucleotide-binding universal stress UspA family protein